MLPSQNTKVIADGLNFLIGQYRGLPNITGFLTACLALVQETEDTLWDCIDSQLLTRTFPAGTGQGELSGPPDQALLQVADLVGCPVGTYITSQLAFLIQIWILARKSNATSEAILAILATAFPGGASAFNYQEYYPAAYEIWVPNVPSEALIAPIAQALTIARPPGVAATLAWGAWPAATLFFGGYGVQGSGFKNPYGAPVNAKGFLAGMKV